MTAPVQRSYVGNGASTPSGEAPPLAETRSWHMLSHTAEYALRAVLHLAASTDGSLERVGEIAEALDVPQNYLSKVLNALARHGILVSLRGPRGGFQLARSPEELTLAQVVSPFDPMDDHPRCLLIQKPCSDVTPCIAHHEWKAVAVQVRAFFRQTTVADLLRSGAPGFQAVPTLVR